ncbi:murein DD-endopeptidase MepM/ murein hydrolase activator NlpD [Parabacteroides sp. PFB2-10]|nr:M23 family metallopeptidase [Parabacteroides sp. PFB2-10]MDH6312333.1 murein DD-endopeptidase MepM/ murein hydrolase activator NlpD [Parabacteroides sp. PFB2-10]
MGKKDSTKTNRTKKKATSRSEFWHKMRFKYKLSFFNESALEEVWSFRISMLSAVTMVLFFAGLLVTLTSMIIILTPIRNYLPGYLDVEVRKEIVQNVLRADSLERMIAIQAMYLDNIQGILTGTTEIDSIRTLDTLAQINPDFEIVRGENEKAFIQAFEEEERYNLTSLNPNPIPDGIFFVKPLNGVMSAAYNQEIKHYGIDLVASLRESVLSTLDGTVVFTGFDPKFGNVIQVQHRNGFLSVYKHNELLLKEIGDQVVAGEAIALVGNTGDLSTGPHLHFELWYRGQPVNPGEYIAF